MTDTLRAHAEALGVQVTYHDVAGNLHHADETTLEHVVAVLDADLAAAATPTRVTPPLHISATDPVVVSARVNAASLNIAGHPHDLTVRHASAVDDGDSIDLPVDLPYGCHHLQFDSASGPGETIVVVAPPEMPRAERFAGHGSLFAPAYALWERSDPLPSYAHLHELARAAKTHGIDVVSTLPLYATYLDDPVDPSPYSPISRLHWNEVYLDDAGLPPAPVPTMGDVIDWQMLAATSTFPAGRDGQRPRHRGTARHHRIRRRPSRRRRLCPLPGYPRRRW